MDKRVGIIINPSLKINNWQYKCILSLKDYHLFFLIASQSDKDFSYNKILNAKKNFIYYLINYFSIRQKKQLINFRDFKKHTFIKLTYKNNLKGWSCFDKKSLNKILSINPEFIYKCGMNLLSIPESLNHIPILSHHHGDPSEFRGRPAGFYELLSSKKKLGQIIQILSNKLDGGKIIAFGETKVYPWSYKKTLSDAYYYSPFLFKKALKNLNQNIIIEKIPSRNLYTLPSNKQCIIFLFLVFKNLIKRIFKKDL